jgi:hypothetical protein
MASPSINPDNQGLEPKGSEFIGNFFNNRIWLFCYLAN